MYGARWTSRPGDPGEVGCFRRDARRRSVLRCVLRSTIRRHCYGLGCAKYRCRKALRISKRETSIGDRLRAVPIEAVPRSVCLQCNTRYAATGDVKRRIGVAPYRRELRVGCASLASSSVPSASVLVLWVLIDRARPHVGGLAVRAPRSADWSGVLHDGRTEARPRAVAARMLECGPPRPSRQSPARSSIAA